MDYYDIWVNLKPGTNDMEFVKSVRAYLDHIVASGSMNGYRVRRRKFGFGPDGLGEFSITLSFESLAKLDQAFADIARRTGVVEDLHRAVYSKVTDFKAALYRDYPDSVRDA